VDGLEKSERDLHLDHDRKGVPGSPDLARLILDKIKRSAIFVADVTNIGSSIFQRQRSERAPAKAKAPPWGKGGAPAKD
jgi:hypothetical protein